MKDMERNGPPDSDYRQPCKFRLRIDNLENAAFEEDRDAEIIRILEVVAARIRNMDTSGTIRDVNGNTVGDWEIR
jgi:hypothetical protein